MVDRGPSGEGEAPTHVPIAFNLGLHTREFISALNFMLLKSPSKPGFDEPLLQ